MGLEFITLRKQEEEALTLYTADRRLWLTSDRARVVEDGDPEAAFQLVSPGQGLSQRDAIRFGLVKAAEKPDDKAMPAPADKSVRSKPNKGA